MEYKNGELLYVCKTDSHWKNGIFVLYRGTYDGNEDLSYHGSPWYEKFIICEHIDSHERIDFGSQSFRWVSASGYISNLQNKLSKIHEISM